MKLILPTIATVAPLLLGLAFAIPTISGYGSNSNYYIGVSPTLCTYTSASSDVYVSSTWITTTGYDAYSVQMNSYAAPNSASISFLQFVFEVGYYGNVFAGVQYWINPQQYVYFVTTSTLDSLGGNGLVNSGSAFDIAAITNSNRKIYQVGFSFYDSYKGQWYSTTINIPNAYQLPLTAWQLNIVGQNGGAYVQFIYPTSGGITYSAYNSLTYGTLLSIGCYQSPLLQTAETSNMIYGTPTVSGGQITQSYVY